MHPDGPPPNRRAAIDVGTNSVKLLVADVFGHAVQPLFERTCQTRLGAGFYPDKRLTVPAIARTAEVVGDFASKARRFGANPIRVLATSAAREAQNADELASAIRQSSGLDMEILSGDREAELAFVGVASSPRIAGSTLFLIEVGGGSTQFVVGRPPVPSFRCSLPVGAVRLLQSVSPSEPPTPADQVRCQAAVRSALEGRGTQKLRAALASLPSAPEAVASGGTATVLGAMHQSVAGFDRDKIESAVLMQNDLHEWLDRLWSLPLSERRQIPGLPPERADVILTGASILEGAMACFELPSLRISTRGLRFGAVTDRMSRATAGREV